MVFFLAPIGIVTGIAILTTINQEGICAGVKKMYIHENTNISKNMYIERERERERDIYIYIARYRCLCLSVYILSV